MAGAHDVVLGLGDRAERREPAVLADRVEPVAAAGQDLVRVGLVADVPEDLVARRVEQAVQRDGELAGAEVGAEVAADLADRVDDQLADLLRDLRELVVVEALRGPRGPSIVSSSSGSRRSVWSLIDCLVWMKSVISSRSLGVAVGLGQRRARLGVRLGGELAGSLEAEEADVGELSVSLVGCRAAFRAPRPSRSRRGCRRRSGTGRRARRRSAGTGLSQPRGCPRGQRHAHAGGDQPPGLQRVQVAQAARRRAPRRR